MIDRKDKRKVRRFQGSGRLSAAALAKMEGVELSNNLRNLLQSTKGGIPLKRLDAEFYTFSGVHIPLGAYKDLEDLLKTMPDVCHVRNNDRGQAMVFVSITYFVRKYFNGFITLFRALLSLSLSIR